jgi:hypothetical protein
VIKPPGRLPGPGQWVEVHTVYATETLTPCLKPESLKCCHGKTILVLGFHAKVTAGGADGPILTPWSHRVIEWSGSSTGPDPEGAPAACKATPAKWSFRMGCDFTVSQAQLEKHLSGGPQAARALQGRPRTSQDLVYVPANP